MSNTTTDRAELKREASSIQKELKNRKLSPYTKKQLNKRHQEISDLLCGFEEEKSSEPTDREKALAWWDQINNIDIKVALVQRYLSRTNCKLKVSEIVQIWTAEEGEKELKSLEIMQYPVEAGMYISYNGDFYKEELYGDHWDEITKRVNCYDDLVNALKDLVSICQHSVDSIAYLDEIEAAKKAILKASK